MAPADAAALLQAEPPGGLRPRLPGRPVLGPGPGARSSSRPWSAGPLPRCSGGYAHLPPVQPRFRRGSVGRWTWAIELRGRLEGLRAPSQPGEQPQGPDARPVPPSASRAARDVLGAPGDRSSRSRRGVPRPDRARTAPGRARCFASWPSIFRPTQGEVDRARPGGPDDRAGRRLSARPERPGERLPQHLAVRPFATRDRRHLPRDRRSSPSSREFIDVPVKNYSTGMYARLGFSVAVHLEPDVLLVDEVLAVGDEHFQQKCLARMEDLRRRGTTIVLVSHDLQMIERMCDRVCLLVRGRLDARGRAGQGHRALPRAARGRTPHVNRPSALLAGFLAVDTRVSGDTPAGRPPGRP